MAFGVDTSNPTRFLAGQSTTDTRNLALQQFGGEVLAAFDRATVFKDLITRKDLPRGSKGWRFPKTWLATAEYHTPGQEMMGNPIATTDVLITPDDILVAHTAIADLDEMLTHFDVSSRFSMELGRGIARLHDKNVARQLILTARMPADGPFPGGTQLNDDTLKPNAQGVYNGLAWVNAIRRANESLFNHDVPEDMDRTLVVSRACFDAIKYAQDANGRYLVLDRFLNVGEDAGGIVGRGQMLMIDNVQIIASRNMPNTNEGADNTVYPKYRGDFSRTQGILFTADAAAEVVLRDVTLEAVRDVRRLEHFMAASFFCGVGSLRGELAVEFNSAT